MAGMNVNIAFAEAKQVNSLKLTRRPALLLRINFT